MALSGRIGRDYCTIGLIFQLECDRNLPGAREASSKPRRWRRRCRQGGTWGPAAHRWQQRAGGPPGRDDVQIDVAFTGICGTALHILHGAALGVAATRLETSEFGRTNHMSVAACGNSPSDGRLYNFFESKDKPTNIQQCAFLGPVTQSASNLYSIYRKNSSGTGNFTTWQVNINGAQVHVRNVGFDGAQIALASGELTTDAIVFQLFGHIDGTVYGCYGCSATPLGVIGWQWTTLDSSSGWEPSPRLTVKTSRARRFFRLAGRSEPPPGRPLDSGAASWPVRRSAHLPYQPGLLR